MMTRPLKRARINELEALFERSKGDLSVLRNIIEELGERKTSDRTYRLEAQVREQIDNCEAVNPAAPNRWPPVSNTESAPIIEITPVSAAATSPRTAAAPITNAPEKILTAWTGLEVLSPFSFKRPEELKGDGSLFEMDGRHLPWNGEGEKSRPQRRLYYQLILGVIDIEKAVNQLLEKYSDARIERPTAKGKAALAVLMLDKKGCPIEDQAVTISSFGWGVPRALQEDLNSLAAWAEAERPLNEQLDGLIRRRNDKGELLPLTYQTIGAAYNWLVSALGLSAELVEAPEYIVRSYQYFKNPDPPEALLLNSFYLNDLDAARKQFKDGTASANLKRYLGVIQPEVRHDLLEDMEALDDALAPELIPAARWPGPGRHSLVLLQQAAVNLALRELKTDGILAVNGPPGTGKTTLLRDLVSAIITRRAEAMCAFDDPAKVFKDSGQKTQAGNASMHMYKLDPKLKGFEMVVASTNNKAVQNVSAELPGLQAIADDAENLRYFSTISDEVREKETWGLIAAVLGNSKNRTAFNKIFWWDDERSLRTYLSAASGTPQNVPVLDPETKEVIGHRPREIVKREKPPSGHAEALARWKKARTAFQSALKKSRTELKALTEARACQKNLLKLEEELREREDGAARADQTYAAAQDAARQCAHACTKAEEYLYSVSEAQRHHQKARPGFFARLFRTQSARDWTEKLHQLMELHARAAAAKQTADKRLDHAKSQSHSAELAAKTAATRRLAAASAYNQANSVVESVRERLGAQFVDDAFFESPHAFKHQLTPWLDKPTQRLRDDVFVAALNLHRAFIDVAARPPEAQYRSAYEDDAGKSVRHCRTAKLDSRYVGVVFSGGAFGLNDLRIRRADVGRLAAAGARMAADR